MKKIVSLVCALFIGMLAVNTSVSATADRAPKLNDTAGLLTESEALEVSKVLQRVYNDYGVYVAIYTLDDYRDYNYSDIMPFADDYMDVNYYLQGEENGILLVLSMDDRSYWVSTTGEGIDAVTDDAASYMDSKFLSYLSDGDYKNGFIAYADVCAELIKMEKDGHPYEARMPIPFKIGISIVIGLIVALIPWLKNRADLESVALAFSANDYIKPGSFKVTHESEKFLYKNVTKTVRQTSSSSGSSTHRSSSGVSHGGHGGHF